MQPVAVGKASVFDLQEKSRWSWLLIEHLMILLSGLHCNPCREDALNTSSTTPFHQDQGQLLIMINNLIRRANPKERASETHSTEGSQKAFRRASSGAQVEFRKFCKEEKQSLRRGNTYALVITFKDAQTQRQESRARKGSMCAVSASPQSTLFRPAHKRANDSLS